MVRRRQEETGHPDGLGELFLIDGANPVPEPFITEADLPEFRAMFTDPALLREAEQARGTPRQILLTGQDILDLNLEMDSVRAEILTRYRKIDRPITMIMSTSMAGDSTEGRTAWRNQNWRNGVERLVRELPDIHATWLDAGHDLLRTHAPDIARIIRGGNGS